MVTLLHILAEGSGGGPLGGNHALAALPLGVRSEGNRRDPRERRDLLELYDEVRPALRRYLSCLGVRGDSAEDVIQESFLKLYRHLLSGGKADNLRAWVFRVAHNFAADALKSNRRVAFDTDHIRELLETALDPSLSPEEVLLKKEQLSRLRAAIGRLTEQQRQSLHLRAEGLRYREIAAVLDVGTTRVADIVQAALARLAGDLYD